jgi:hypothetical protein
VTSGFGKPPGGPQVNWTSDPASPSVSFGDSLNFPSKTENHNQRKIIIIYIFSLTLFCDESLNVIILLILLSASNISNHNYD